jgi:hypothetical protein
LLTQDGAEGCKLLTKEICFIENLIFCGCLENEGLDVTDNRLTNLTRDLILFPAELNLAYGWVTRATTREAQKNDEHLVLWGTIANRNSIITFKCQPFLSIRAMEITSRRNRIKMISKCR